MLAIPLLERPTTRVAPEGLSALGYSYLVASTDPDLLVNWNEDVREFRIKPPFGLMLHFGPALKQAGQVSKGRPKTSSPVCPRLQRL